MSDSGETVVTVERDLVPQQRGTGRTRNQAAKAPMEGELISGTPKWKRDYPEAKAVRVIFDDVEEAVGGNIFVAVNGEAFLIKTGVEAEVPDFLLDHLDNSITGAPVVDQRTRQVTGYRNVTRFPYRVVR